MHKINKILLGFVLLGVASPAFTIEWAAPQALSAEAGVDLAGWGIGVGGGLELGLLRWELAPQVKLNVSAKVLSFAGVSLALSPSFGLGAYGVIHYGLKQLNSGNDFINRLDYFIGLGVSTVFPFVSGNAGISCDLGDELAIIVQNEGFTGGMVGLKLKL
jgi:hypothetical protein